MSNPNFRKRDLIFPVFLPSVLFTAGETAIIPILPTAAQHLGANLPTAGLIAGMGMIGTVLFDVPASRLVHKIGERRAMIWSSFLATFAMLCAMFANSLVLLALAVLVGGAMSATFGLARHAFMAEQVPSTHRARALSLLGGMFRAGGFLGPLMGSAVVFVAGIGWVYVAAAVLCLASMVVLLNTPAEALTNEKARPHGGTLAIAKREWRKLATVGMAATIVGILRNVRQLGLPLWALYIGMHPGTASLYIGIAGFLDFLLFYSSGQIMDRFGRRWALVPTLLGMAVTQYLLTLAHTPTAFLLVALAMSLANALGSGIVLTLGADLSPDDARGEFLAAFRLMIDSGVAITPILLSALTVAIALPGAIVSFASLSLVGAWLGWRYLPRHGIR